MLYHRRVPSDFFEFLRKGAFVVLAVCWSLFDRDAEQPPQNDEVQPVVGVRAQDSVIVVEGLNDIEDAIGVDVDAIVAEFDVREVVKTVVVEVVELYHTHHPGQ